MARRKKSVETVNPAPVVKSCGSCKWYEPNLRIPGRAPYVGIRNRCKYRGDFSPECESDLGYADYKARQWVTAESGSNCEAFIQFVEVC